MRFILSVVLIPLVVGCASYKHERKVDVLTGATTETTSFRSPWLTKTTVEGLKSRVSDKADKNGARSYTRSIGVGSVANETDVEGLKALEALIGRSLLEALKTSTVP
jgi:hypothetical protein